MVSGHGVVTPKLMFIGDGASEEDCKSGYALTGIAESKLRELCHSAEINFNKTYRTVLIKERINLNKPKANIPLLNDTYNQILTQEIRDINPDIIVPLCELSFEFVTGLKSIYKYRGSLLPISDKLQTTSRKVQATLGQYPYLSQDPSMEYITRLDFSKIARNLDRIEEPIKEVGMCWVAKTAESLHGFFKRHYQKCAAKSIADGGYLVFDIETFCGIPHCISFCFDGEEAATAPYLDKSISSAERILMLREISILLRSPIPKVNQNIKFDWRKLEQRVFGFKVHNIVGDTNLAASCLYPQFDKNLGFLISLYTDMPYHKDEGKQFDPQVHHRDRLYLYCAKDSLGTHKVYFDQQKELKETGTEAVYNQLIRILPIYKTMEENGIRLDMEQNRKLIAKYSCLFEIEVLKAQKMVGNDKFNPLSDDQVRRVVFEELRYNKPRGVTTTKLGKPSTDEDSLEILMWMGEYNAIANGKAILKSVINCRKLHKVLEYLLAPVHPDHHARCEFNLAGTYTGRTTTGKTTDGMLIFDKGKVKYKDVGRSFQNIGKHGFEVDGAHLGTDIRSQFVPTSGFCFIEVDLSQAEARVDAVLARDYDILSVFDGPVGIHRLTGSWVFDCPPEEIKKGILVDGIDRYHQSKTVRHAGERNMKSDRLMIMIHEPIKKCQQILNIFHKNQPNIQDVFHREIRSALQTQRSLVAPNGRKCDFFGRYDQHMINEGISLLPQAIVTDYMKRGIDVYFNNDHASEWARPLSEAHDGFLAEVPIPRRNEYADGFQAALCYPVDFNTCTLSRDFKLTIPSEVEWSDTNWKEMGKLK
jgi:uracil-DNA glycosylase